MTGFDDLEAEQDRLALARLSDAQWASASLAPGWTVRDVVLHLAQGEEMAVARLSGAPNPAAHDPAKPSTTSTASKPCGPAARTAPGRWPSSAATRSDDVHVPLGYRVTGGRAQRRTKGAIQCLIQRSGL